MKKEKVVGRAIGTLLDRNIARQYRGRLERKIERKIDVGDFFDSEKYPALLKFLYDLDDEDVEVTEYTAEQRDTLFEAFDEGVTPDGFENLVDFAERITQMMISTGLYSEPGLEE
jgi:hypothetical protein